MLLHCLSGLASVLIEFRRVVGIEHWLMVYCGSNSRRQQGLHLLPHAPRRLATRHSLEDVGRYVRIHLRHSHSSELHNNITASWIPGMQRNLVGHASPLRPVSLPGFAQVVQKKNGPPASVRSLMLSSYISSMSFLFQASPERHACKNPRCPVSGGASGVPLLPVAAPTTPPSG